MIAKRALLVSALIAGLAAGCGGGSANPPRPFLGVRGGQHAAAQDLGFPTFATKNTTRVGGGDPVADAAGVARAVFPGATPASSASTVALVDQADWRAGLAASVLMAAPVRAPVLLTNGRDLPPASSDALAALAPRGSQAIGGAQVIRVGDVARPGGLRSVDVGGAGPFALASAIDRFATAAKGSPSPNVVVVGVDDPAYAMPAAAWAAKAGDSILFVNRDGVPAATQQALRRHLRPRIYVLGPASTVGPKAMAQLAGFGRVTRIAGPDPVANAVAFARFVDRGFGWGVIDPGHGLVFANVSQPTAAVAAAPLSASGSYGPLLVLRDPNQLPVPLARFLLSIEPGYSQNPVRGVYNHGWLIGDETAVSTELQARIDTLLEIAPVDTSAPSTS